MKLLKCFNFTLNQILHFSTSSGLNSALSLNAAAIPKLVDDYIEKFNTYFANN